MEEKILLTLFWITSIVDWLHQEHFSKLSGFKLWWAYRPWPFPKGD